jgi:hypothetical protein
MLDIYVYCIDDKIFKKFTPLQRSNVRIFQLRHYQKPEINGILTQNIFHRLYKYPCHAVSKDIKNSNHILGIVVNPEGQCITYDIDTLMTSNFHDDEFKKSLGATFYGAFQRICYNREILSRLTKCVDEMKPNNFNLHKHYKILCEFSLPFQSVQLNVDEIDTFVSKFQINDYKFAPKNEDLLNKREIKTVNTIKYTCCDINCGIGDFIQRFERLYRLLNYSSNTFQPFKNKRISYKNTAHGGQKYLTMYDFPGYDFIENIENLDDYTSISIPFENLCELLLYDRSFYSSLPKNVFLDINLGSYILDISKRPLIKHMFNWDNDEKIMRNVNVPYSPLRWKLPVSVENFAVVHFRRGDYVSQMMTRSNPRKMTTCHKLLNELVKTVQLPNLNIVILSDHYNTSLIPADKKQYIDVMFDYDKYSVGDKFMVGDTKINVIDKVIGISDETNYKSLLYFTHCDYHIGNMSCFPQMMFRIFDNKKVKSVVVDHDISNMSDVIRLHETKDKWLKK